MNWNRFQSWVVATVIAVIVMTILGSYESRTGSEWGWNPQGFWQFLGIAGLFIGWRARWSDAWSTENFLGLMMALAVVWLMSSSFTYDCWRDGCESGFEPRAGTLTAGIFAAGFWLGLIAGLVGHAFSAIRRQLTTR